ncbi:hypothetical protein J6590_101974 [Homalodisca vitripennis]|nr:hypothetical protein J6590_101974 [Homalodisca vitripennis]
MSGVCSTYIITVENILEHPALSEETDHQKVQLREEPTWLVTLEQPMRTERHCQTQRVVWQRRIGLSILLVPANCTIW